MDHDLKLNATSTLGSHFRLGLIYTFTLIYRRNISIVNEQELKLNTSLHFWVSFPFGSHLKNHPYLSPNHMVMHHRLKLNQILHIWLSFPSGSHLHILHPYLALKFIVIHQHLKLHTHPQLFGYIPLWPTFTDSPLSIIIYIHTVVI